MIISRLLPGTMLCFLLELTLPCHAAEAELPPLTSAKGNPRLPGKFIWADLVTDDVSKAMNFYAQVFGWRFAPAGNYYIAINDSHPIAGIFQKPRPPNEPNAKPRWFGYISVPSVKKAETVVNRSGGRTIASRQDFPKRGEQAVFADPEGAIFGVMRSSSGDPEDFLASPGDWVWVQLLTRDARKATDFYREVGGYEVVENPSANRLNDYVLTSEGFARATIRTLSTQGRDVNPTWLPYIRVDDVPKTVAKARQLGANVLVEPRPSLLDGKVAVISDPTGAAVGLLAWMPEVNKGDR
jgi:predicted enzyme related to lactoylglutathione lyase